MKPENVGDVLSDPGKLDYKGPVPAHKPKYEYVPNQQQPTQTISPQDEPEIETQKSEPNYTDHLIHKPARSQEEVEKTYQNTKPMHNLEESGKHFERMFHKTSGSRQDDSTALLPDSFAPPNLETDFEKPEENLSDYVDSMLKNLEKYQDLEEYDGEMDTQYIDMPQNGNVRKKAEEKSYKDIDFEKVDQSEESEYRMSFFDRFRKNPPDNNRENYHPKKSDSSYSVGHRLKNLAADKFQDDFDKEIEGELPEQSYEYKNASELKDRQKYVSSLQFIGMMQGFLLTILFVLSLFMTYLAYSPKPVIWESISPTVDPTAFYSVNFLILILSVATSSRMIFIGLIDFFTFKSTGDSTLSILSMVSTFFSIYLIGNPDFILDSGIHYYNSVVIAGLLINCISKLIVTKKTKDNLDMIAETKKWKAAEMVTDEGLEDELLKILGEPGSAVAVKVKTGFLRRFLELSLETESVDRNERIIAPVCFFSSIALSAGSYIVHHNIGESISLFIACMCICSPFTSLLCSNLPVYLSAKKLRHHSAMISGNDSVYDFSQTSAMVLDAADLFPKGTVSLQALKTFEGGRIDEAIIDATSVVYSLSSTLSGMFMGIIENRTNILNQVDTIVYEDEMGVSAWVNGRRVLIGNRDLMINHDIDLPSNEYEKKYTVGGREIVYLATSGVLSAMYVVKYHADKKIAELLRKLCRQSVTMIVRTTDPNITTLKLSQIFELDIDSFRVVPDRSADRYKYITKPRTKVDAKLAFSKGVVGYLRGILESIRLGSTISMLTILQIMGMIVGYIAITICAFFSGLDWLTADRILVYNSFMTAITIIISNIRQIK